MKLFTAYALDTPTFSIGAIAIVPIIIAIVQAFKMTGWIKDKYAPLLSILVGIVIGFIADHNAANLTNTILSGVMYGLSASGLYSGVQETTKAIKQERIKKEQKQYNRTHQDENEQKNYQSKHHNE